jgi:hypothetical protein
MEVPADRAHMAEILQVEGRVARIETSHQKRKPLAEGLSVRG